jgi:sporulation protein YlmC with PRC-barrel domain
MHPVACQPENVVMVAKNIKLVNKTTPMRRGAGRGEDLAFQPKSTARRASCLLCRGGHARQGDERKSATVRIRQASDIYKADVYDNAEDKIGVVTDLIVDNSGTVTTAVVSVGGLLGVGKKDVAVPFKDLKVASRDGKDWLVLNQTKEDLKVAPAYDKKTNSQM